jgi:hypothetical protein
LILAEVMDGVEAVNAGKIEYGFEYSIGALS